jgi:hypothetical protein
MAKLTTTDLTSLSSNETSSVNTINANNAAIEAAMENTLSRDGTTPNGMSADFDMDSNDILNAGVVNATSFKVGGVDPVAAAAASAAAALVSEANASTSAINAASSESAASVSAAAALVSESAAAASAANGGPYDSLVFTPQASEPTFAEGTFFYDDNAKTFVGMVDESEVRMNVGEEHWITARNTTGATLTDGKVVFISGASGNRPLITLAQADAHSTSHTIGMVTHDIEDNSNGKVTTIGLVKGFDTSSFSEGVPIYLDATTAGGLTATKPTGANFKVLVGYVTRSHATLGEFLVHVDGPVEDTDLTWTNPLTISEGGTGSTSTADAQTNLAIKVIQSVNAQTGAVQTGTIVIPNDDTKPQQTEGNEVLTLAITPTNASNNLDITFEWNGSSTITGNLMAALFRDAGADAIKVSWSRQTSTSSSAQITGQVRVAAGSTSATTFKLRVGNNNAGTLTTGGQIGARRFGGILFTSIKIEEVLP